MAAFRSVVAIANNPCSGIGKKIPIVSQILKHEISYYKHKRISLYFFI